jgi:hypothetical protein
MNLGNYLSNETLLLSDLLDPAAEVIQSYSVRYLQAFDQVVSATEQVRLKIRELKNQDEYKTLICLEEVQQLRSGAVKTLDDLIVAAVNSSDLFPQQVTHDTVERELVNWPQPMACPLSLENAHHWIAEAKSCLEECSRSLKNALLDKAALLYSDALRNRLQQGKGDSFISTLLDASSPQILAQVLVDQFSDSTNPKLNTKIEILQRYLQQISVRKVHMSDFKPSKRTIEIRDLEKVVKEFDGFLREKLQVDKDDEISILEIE